MEYRFKWVNLLSVIIGAFTMGLSVQSAIEVSLTDFWNNTMLFLFFIGFFCMGIPILKSRVRISKK